MNWLKYPVVGASLVLAMSSTTQAQVLVDMSKFTCTQLLSGSPNAIEAAIWTSGYYNGLIKNTMIDLNGMKHNADVVVAACKDNPNKTIMQTVDTLLSAGTKK
jgi:hypothetical protein